MALSTRLFVALLAGVGLLRLIEISISRRHQWLLVRHGARKAHDPSFRWMVLLHVAILAGAAIEVVVARRPLVPVLAVSMGIVFVTANVWGSVPHWNAFVANLEMHGVGRFWDPRLNDASRFPIAAAHGFGDLPHISPDDDRITSKLSDLQFYQLAIPSPQPPAGSFDQAAADRGDELFGGKAKCNNCHVEPLWTDPGWKLHTPAEICIDDFQADRAPDRRYRTSPIGALFTHLKGGFYHDGRFPTLAKVVDHYDTCMNLNLSSGEKNDLIQYLLSLTFDESN